MDKVINILIIILSLIFFCYFNFGCIPYKDITLGKPTIVLTNSKGEKAKTFAPMDVLYGSFSNLKPDHTYQIKIIRSDGGSITDITLRSNAIGVIPTAALWWDIGAEYNNARTGKLNLTDLYAHSYSCLLILNDESIAEVPFRILEMEKAGPIIFSSDRDGNPLNGFIHQREGVYIRGINFPPGLQLQIFAVENQYSWEESDLYRLIREDPIILQLEEDQRDFLQLVVHPEITRVGAYDLIVEYTGQIGLYNAKDLVDQLRSPGYTVFNFAPPTNHIEADLACQAPPQDIYGNIIGAPNPVYKDVFAPVEEVWVAINPNTGSANYVGKSARLYVVHHKPKTGWIDEIALLDVSSDNFNTTIIQPGCANVNYNPIWNKPSIGDYDVVVDFAPFGIYNLGKDIVDKLDLKGFLVPPLWICLESITFNHDLSNTNDAINIRIDKNKDVVIPEWQKQKQAYPAAYIKNKTITIQAVFSAAPGIMSATIRADKASGLLSDVVARNVTFSSGTSGPVNFQLKTSVPNEILLFNQIWKWYGGNVNGTGSTDIHLGHSKNKLYVILDQPMSPWTLTGQSKPWTKVLQKSCTWAYGKTNPVDAAEQVQHHLYEDLGGYYKYNPQYTSAMSGDFEMTNFLGNMNMIGNVNCYDMGKSLVSFANVLGGGLVYKLSMSFDSLNCVKAIGKNWFCSEYFNNHAFGNIGNNVFDACLTVDTDNDPTKFPHKNTWMTNIPWTNYKTTVVKNATAAAPTMYNFKIK